MPMTYRCDYSALILAAGASSRMGALKPLLPLGDETVLQRIVGLFRAAAVTDIRVVLGFNAERFMSMLTEMDVSWVINSDYRQGMFSSIQTGVRTLEKTCQAFFLLPGDMPFVKLETLRALMTAFDGGRDENEADAEGCERGINSDAGRIYRPLYHCRHGHPPLIPAEFSPAILAFDAPGGLRALLNCYERQCVDVPCNDPGILIDLDTPADCERYGASL